MRAKQDLALATEGYQLLDQKREVLVLELLQLLSRLRERARKAREKLADGYRAMAEAELAIGPERMEALSAGPATSTEISAVERSVMGVAIPTVGDVRPGRGPEGGLVGTVSELDEAVSHLKEAVPEIARWAELALAVHRLAAELKKIMRRVNALREVFIPGARRRIATISAALEEAEREEFFRRKRVKSKLCRREDRHGSAWESTPSREDTGPAPVAPAGAHGS